MKYVINLENGTGLVIIIHNTGRREIYLNDNDNRDNIKLFELNDRLARIVGSILEGAYYNPIKTENVKTHLDGNSIIEWYEIPNKSKIQGKSVNEINSGETYGIKIIACKQKNSRFSVHDPSTIIEPSCLVITIGTLEDHQKFHDLIKE